jgi:multimeric flavodoxin WrbA
MTDEETPKTKPGSVEDCVMRVLAITGSFRKTGNTARIVQMMETRLRVHAAQQNEPLEFETLFMGDVDMRHCRGCRACFDHGEDTCPLHDDVSMIRDKMDAADVLIMASPVYVDDVSGLLKNLMDRLAYLCHRPALGGKYAYAVATVGGGAARHTLRTMNAALLTWGCHLLGRSGYKMGALATEGEVQRYQHQVDEVAKKLLYAITRKRNLIPAFISLLAFRIQQMVWRREPEGSYDQGYWNSQGWLEPGCTYYHAHRASPVKVMLARFVGAIVSRFVL